MGKLSTHQRRARSFVQRSDWESALGEMRHALTSDSNNPAIHNQMGDLYLRVEDVENACEHFEKAIDLYAQLGLHNNAVALCRKVIRLAPSHVDVRYSLARLRFDQGLRADGVAAFNDYLDNVSTQGEHEVAAFEERCRALLDAHQDVAPVGKILKRLESVHSFRCAFEIVQRLAQRAADAGDNDSARKYTEKMRSLRVLVEGSGGGDLLAEPPPTAATPHAAVDDGVDPPMIEIDDAVGPPVLELPELEPAAPAAEMSRPMPLDAPAVEPAPSEPPAPPAATNELNVSLDDLLEPAVPPTAPDASVSMPAPQPNPNLDIDIGGDDAPQTPQVDAVEDDALPDDTVQVHEYELPEASLEDLASMFDEQGQESPQSDPIQEAADEAPAIDVTPAPPVAPIFALGAQHEPEAGPVAGEEQSVVPPAAPQRPVEAAPPAAAALPIPEAPAVPSVPAQPPGVATPEPDAIGATDAQDLEAFEPPEPNSGATPAQHAPPQEVLSSRQMAALDARNAQNENLREPVWIPDPHADPTASPNPGTGQVHELEDVIETFRDQMAKALGSDASARYDLGVAYYEMGLYNEALSEFEAAVQDARYREQCLELMAACLAMQGRHAETVEMLTPLLESSHASDSGLGLRYTMGVACEALGLREQARHHFEQIARIDSSYRDVQARLMLY